MNTNTTKQKLNNGETVYGAFFRTPDTSLVELQGYLGWDFLVLDGEHGTLQPRDIEDQCRACELRGITPIARVTTNEQSIILRFMDTGVQGALIPFVNTAADAECAVQSIKYQPRGQRGLAGIRAADFGRTGTLGDYVKRANTETLVVAQIETAEAVENLPEIVKTDGVDVIFIGPNDLDRKSTRLNSSHVVISYAVFCLKKKTKIKSKHSMHSHTMKTHTTHT